MHGAGWLEGGLRCSYEKIILDIDLLQMVAEFLTPLDCRRKRWRRRHPRVGPGGHFFGTQHTQDRYKTAFYSPILSDWRNFETWAKPARRPRSSGPTGSGRSGWRLRGALDGPGASARNSTTFVDKRKAEGGAPTDF